MASFTIPLVFAAEPKPDRLFSLDISHARKHPDSIDTFATDTWNSCAGSEVFPGDISRKSQRPRIRDVLAYRCSILRRNQFRPFPRLPVELQEKVWESCLEPVTHTVLCLVELERPIRPSPPNRLISNKTWLLESPGQGSDRRIFPVPLWQICRQSRAVANRIYRLLQPGVYFSPMIDTVRLSILPSTQVYRRLRLEPPQAQIVCSRNLVDQNSSYFVVSDDSFDEIVDFSDPYTIPPIPPVKDNSEYIYRHFVHWNTSYKTHLHEYCPPYSLSLISREILQEVQNLEVLFYYDPHESIAKQDLYSHLFTYFLADNCPILDLTGLRRLLLKVGVVMNLASSTDSLAGLESWRELIHKLVAPEDREKEEKQGPQMTVLPKLRSLEVAKVCALAERPMNLVSRTMSSRSAACYHVRRRLLTKLCESWRPSRRDIRKSRQTNR